MPKLNKWYYNNIDIFDSIIFLLYIITPFYILYMIYKYGFFGYLEKKRENRIKRGEYILHNISSI